MADGARRPPPAPMPKVRSFSLAAIRRDDGGEGAIAAQGERAKPQGREQGREESAGERTSPRTSGVRGGRGAGTMDSAHVGGVAFEALTRDQCSARGPALAPQVIDKSKLQAFTLGTHGKSPFQKHKEEAEERRRVRGRLRGFPISRRPVRWIAPRPLRPPTSHAA